MRTVLAVLRPSTCVGCLWALRCLAKLRADLVGEDVRRVRVAAPPAVAAGGTRAVIARVLARTGATCLQRSLILQAWDRAHGTHRAVVVGVTAPGPQFRAHAWIDGDEVHEQQEFAEILRVEA